MPRGDEATRNLLAYNKLIFNKNDDVLKVSLSLSYINVFLKFFNELSLLRNKSCGNRTSLNVISCTITRILAPAKYSAPPESIKMILRRLAQKN